MVKENKILVSEIFESIDGEGYNAGFPSVFFRVVGCNLRCKWCDSKYTYEKDLFSKWVTVEEAFYIVESYGLKHITITGGEPLLEENKRWMSIFIQMLISEKYKVSIETNGSVDYVYWKKMFNDNIVLIMDWKCSSSGMTNRMNENNLSILGEKDIVKLVVSNDDFNEAEKIVNMETKATFYISPVYGQVDLDKIPRFVLKYKNKKVRAQIQLHKVFWSPEKRGV